MGVLVRFGRRKAFLRRGAWFSADPQLEANLNEATETWIQTTGGPPIDDHHHERTVAEEICKQLGGRIVRNAEPPAKEAANLYISRRQMSLDFR